MSTEIDCYYGYGFNYNEVDTLKVPDFLRKHIDAIRKSGHDDFADLVAEDVEDESVLADEADAIDPYYGWNCGGFGGIIAEIMRVELDIGIGCYSDSESGDSSIMWLECVPWNMNEKEKNLTKDSLTKLLRPYMDELGVSGEPDYQKVTVIG